MRFVPQDGEPADYAFVSELKTRAGDVIRVVTGNGGGMGGPEGPRSGAGGRGREERSRDARTGGRDLRMGRLTAERTRRWTTTTTTDRRMMALRAAMAREGTELLALGPGAHMQWLLGFHPHADERPCLLLVGPEGEAFLMPKLNAGAAAEATPIALHRWSDDEGPADALAAALTAVGGSSAGTVALDETMRADFALLLLDRLPGARHGFCDATVGPPAHVEGRRRTGGAQVRGRHRRPGDAGGLGPDAPGHDRGRGGRDRQGELCPPTARRRSSRSSAAGRNGAFPHHATGSTVLKSGEAVVMDIGGTKSGMSSDMTRMAVIGTPPEGYAEVHAVVEAAVQAALAAAKPGVKAHVVDDAARGVIARAGYGDYFLHRTGHGLGVEVHEPPYLTSVSQTVLEEGAVFSIEPGIYLPDRFGIRLEDIVYLTADGPEILSSLPRDVTVIG